MGGATSSSNTSQAFEPGLVADDRRGTFDLQYFFLLEVSEPEIQEHHRSTDCIPRPRNQIRSRGLQQHASRGEKTLQYKMSHHRAPSLFGSQKRGP